jgi:ABC-type transport system involved in multi-copper enzyme maturation permease subunit
MSSTSQTATEHGIPTPKRSDTVVMGRQGFVSVLLRSICGELYKIRRRAMSKILLLIAIGIMIIAFSFSALAALAATSSLSRVSCTIDSRGQQHCVPRSQADIEKQKEDASAPLRLPGSLSTSVSVINFIGTISLVILIGSIVGGEYAVGTIRLMLTRGPTRTQFLLAKIGAVLVCILITLFLLILVGIIVGALFNLTTGIAVGFSFVTGEWVLHAVLYILVAALGLFIYSMIALCLATLGKTTAAGIVGALIWWFLESALGAVLTTVGYLNKGPVGNFLRSIPDYFIGSNISALLDNQNQYLISGATQATLITNTHAASDIRATLVLVAYLVAFIGVAWWIQQLRDITN